MRKEGGLTHLGIEGGGAGEGGLASFVWNGRTQERDNITRKIFCWYETELALLVCTWMVF